MGCRCLEPMCLVIWDRPSFWLCPVPVDNLWVTLAWWVSWLFCTRPLCMRRKLKFSFWNINLLQFFSTFWQLSPLRVESGLESLFFTPVREIVAGKSYSLISHRDFVTHCSICTSISFWLISLGLIKQDGAESQFWKIPGSNPEAVLGSRALHQWVCKSWTFDLGICLPFFKRFCKILNMNISDNRIIFLLICPTV